MSKIGKVVAVAMTGVVVSAAAAQDAVQWRVEDGGNGHWYGLTPILRWNAARESALGIGGDLVSCEDVEELTWVESMYREQERHVGAVQSPDAQSPDAGWIWLSGIPVNWRLVCDDNPCNLGTPAEDGQQDYLHLTALGDLAQFGDVNSVPLSSCPAPAWSGIIEWSADCNEDGIVDYGQILDGTFADKDMNGVPDCCEGDCTGDLNLDNTVDSADLGLLIAAWNTDGSIVDGSDINGDGVVSAADLGSLIAAWGQCSGCN